MRIGSFLPALALLLVSCSAPRVAPAPPPSRDELSRHMIMVDEDGRPLDPATFAPYDHGRILPRGGAYRQHIHDLLEEMRAFHARRAAAGPARQPKKVLIYVHGGMNTLTTARRAAADRLARMHAEDADTFPIFLAWNSGAPAALGEHLHVSRRPGEGPLEPLKAPFFLFADLGRALARAPVVWTLNYRNDRDTFVGALGSLRLGTHNSGLVWENPRLHDVAIYFRHLNARYAADPRHQIAISLGEVRVSDLAWAGRVALYTASWPAKVVTSPLIDALGEGAWQKMNRHTRTLFENPASARAVGKSSAQVEADLDNGDIGALAVFMNELTRTLANDPDTSYQITLVGHSMGAIVLNELVHFYPELPYRNLVYLSAACTINDFRVKALPYVRLHPETQVYILCLHPIAEALDNEGSDLIPLGSLLVWIDAFLENPQTPLDRTMGRFENIAKATYVFPKNTRGQINIKAFDATGPRSGGPDNPQFHGELSMTRFWDEAFWRPGPPRAESDPVIAIARHIEQRHTTTTGPATEPADALRPLPPSHPPTTRPWTPE